MAIFLLFLVIDGLDWLWMKSSQEYPVNAGAPQGTIFGPTLFLLFIKDLHDGVICDISIYVIRHLICGNNLKWLLNLNLI